MKTILWIIIMDIFNSCFNNI